MAATPTPRIQRFSSGRRTGPRTSGSPYFTGYRTGSAPHTRMAPLRRKIPSPTVAMIMLSRGARWRRSGRNTIHSRAAPTAAEAAVTARMVAQ